MLVFANVRERWTSFLAAFVAVLVGVALITTTLIIYDSSRPKVQSRLSAAAALAIPAQAVNQDQTPEDRVPWSPDEARPLIDKLGAVPGVASVVVDRSFYAQAFLDDKPVEDEGALVAGHGWSSARLAPYKLVTGRAPAAADEVVVDRALGVAAGKKLTVNITKGRTEFRVVGTVDGPGYYLTDDFAARQEPGVGAIALLADKGTSAGDIKSGAMAPSATGAQWFPARAAPRSSRSTWSTSGSSAPSSSEPWRRSAFSPPCSWSRPCWSWRPGCGAGRSACCA